MIRVLILAYDFPPYLSVGSLRPHVWFEELSLNEIHPIVVTRQWRHKDKYPKDYVSKSNYRYTVQTEFPHGTLIESSYIPNLPNSLLIKYGSKKFSIIRKFLSAIFEVLQFKLSVGPKKNIYNSADIYLEKNKVDLIIATGDPFVLFHYAHKLSKKHSTPWIADYRDPWSQDFQKKSVILRNFEKKTELKTVSSSLLILTVSEYFKTKIATLFPDKRIEVIPNGFDNRVIQNINLDQQSEILRISFFGNIYDWQPYEEFLEKYFEFIQSDSSVKIKLFIYGTNLNDTISDLVTTKYSNFKKYIEIIPKLPYSELLERVSKDNALLLFNYFDIIGTKIYDYLALRKKIVFCFSHYGLNKISDTNNNLSSYTPQIDLITSTNSGVIVKNPTHLIDVFKNLYSEFCSKESTLTQELCTEKFSRQFQTKKMAHLLKRLLMKEKKECTKCLYNSENYPSIKLNNDGVCDLCELNSQLIYKTKFKQNKEAVDSFIHELKSNRRHKYDCIIGVSGGLDSSYLVHLSKQWGLCPLLVHIDGGWNSESSVQNIKNLIASTNFDFYSEILPWEEIRDVQKAFIEANVLDIDLPFDNAMMSYLYRTAAKFKIRFILNGYSNETEGIMPESYTHYKLDKKNIIDIHKKFGKQKLKSLKFIGTFDYLYFEKIKKINFYQPLDFVSYKKKEVKLILQSEYNWKDYGEKHFENVFTRFYQAFILPKKFGVDKRISHLSVLICSNQITRNDALKYLSENQIDENQILIDLHFFIKKLGLSKIYFDDYIQKKAVSHREFKSDLDFYNSIKPLYKWLKRTFKINLFKS